MATGLRLLLATFLLCVAEFAAAEALPDPTRPAIDLRGGSDTGGAPAERAAPKGLQTIIISPEYRAAIINGETVRLGGKSGDSTLVEVREGSVVLQNSHGRRVLELFPDVSIKKKNQTAPPANRTQENGSGQPGLPERDVGGTK